MISDVGDELGVGQDCVGALPLAQVPDPHGVVTGARSERVPIRRKVDGENVIDVAVQRGYRLTSADVPHMAHATDVPRAHQRAVPLEGKTVHANRVAVLAEELLLQRKIPKPPGRVVARGRDVVAGGVELNPGETIFVALELR
eukprot:CAMPEP_0185258014 /NCGR_PEP_ID=MMETSP1359-20130426/7001_1 /TAXON_ID=552665 /ORGANISM="Bigelowiella longifila, Strain CCMP242" /LENGTH=142 /DNA_ID=CAMNT_0027843341 /DNA_START=291 /DNA_END=719 /DNA_ORIENTATION=-